MIDPNTSIGSFGGAVSELHQILVSKGFDIAPGEADRAFFGPTTRAAVLDLQRQEGLSPTGELDPATVAALGTDSANPILALSANTGGQSASATVGTTGVEPRVTAPNAPNSPNAPNAPSTLSGAAPGSPTPAPPPDNMVTGRLIDTSGSCGSCGQLVFFGTPTNATEARPIGATGTDRKGNFLVPKPAGTFASAYAMAPGFAGADGSAQLPVPLDPGGAFPSSVLLVGARNTDLKVCTDCSPAVPQSPGAAQLADPASPYAQDLGPGGCARLTTPNRTLETYVYRTLVRVDEPALYASHDPASAAQLIDLDGVGSPKPLPPGSKSVVKYLPPPPPAWPPQFNYLNSQAVTISHGHLLEFEQIWKANGYSLGDLLYSLPLAPCQKKQVAVVDWERREAGARSEASNLQDQLMNELTRDRDISEIVNGVVTENLKGSSAANVAGGAAGAGVAGSGSYSGASLGGVVSAFGGGGRANSDAAQISARDLTTNSLQQIHDRTIQVAQNVRSLRTTVVQTVSQAETTTATTDVVANHNHCHALTIEYFEVLRHLLVEHRLAGVQECILVPFLVAPFDLTRAVRWRDELAPALLDGKWKSAFDAAQRVDAGGRINVAAPLDEPDLIDLQIDLQVAMRIERPFDRATRSEPDGAAQGPHYYEDTNTLAGLGASDDPWLPLINLARTNLEPAATGMFAAWYYNHYQTEAILPSGSEKYDVLLARQAERDKDFQAELAAKIAIQFMRQVTAAVPLVAYLDDGTYFRVALVDHFQSDAPLAVSVRLKKLLPGGIKASQVQRITLQSAYRLPLGSRILVRSAAVRFRTALSEWTVPITSVDGDLADADTTVVLTCSSARTTAPSAPAAADVEASNELVDHLNHNIEYYHRAIWTNLDDARRFVLLDSLIDPKLNNHHVASLVENRVVGFLGNSMILPAAPGVHFDFYQSDPGNLASSGESLLTYYGSDGVAPTRISLPTRGVFAEAMLGECSACEVKDDSRFWRWQEAPCGDEPTAIQPVSTASRATPDPNLQAAPLPQSVINIQNAPAEPDPTGLKSALTLLGTSNLFKDITGVDQVNKNASQAFTTAAQGAEQLATEAAGLVKQQVMQQGGYDQQQKKIKQAQADGLITKQQASDLTYQALQTFGGQAKSSTDNGSATKPPAKTASPSGKPSTGAGSAAKPGTSSSSTPARDGSSSSADTSSSTPSDDSSSSSGGNGTDSSGTIVPIPTDVGSPSLTPALFGTDGYAALVRDLQFWAKLNASTDTHKAVMPIGQPFSSDYAIVVPDAATQVKCQFHAADFTSPLSFGNLVDLMHAFEQLISSGGVLQCTKIVGQTGALAVDDEFRFTIDSTPLRLALATFVAAKPTLAYALNQLLPSFDPRSIPDRNFDVRIVDVHGDSTSFEYTVVTLLNHPYAARRSWRLQDLGAGQFRLETGEINTFPWLPDYLVEFFHGIGRDASMRTWQQYLTMVVANANGSFTDSSYRLGVTKYLKKSEVLTEPLVTLLGKHFVGLQVAITGAAAASTTSAADSTPADAMPTPFA